MRNKLVLLRNAFRFIDLFNIKKITLHNLQMKQKSITMHCLLSRKSARELFWFKSEFMFNENDADCVWIVFRNWA